LKNSTGARENPATFIHRFAPPTSETKNSGKKGIATIKIVGPIKSRNPKE